MDLRVQSLIFMINSEDFAKLEIKIGHILSAEKIEGTDKLLRLEVDFGSAEQNAKQTSPVEQNSESVRNVKQIVSGIADFYDPQSLVGKECPFLVNLEPRILRGVESQGMILAVDVEGTAILIHPDREVPAGSKVK